ncbi:hypothetical protein GUJ93_ZPchr0006g43734 [Zizania palustris]|uniref:Uncharacterized protein n=1 Tax=Zizania palustris TaxID=103762 RepID=A0A8J5VH67_ZIZPA|nr:hypothetical protein GUJ93_ZPchr0006g43734 [Zizania palustris]
MGKRYVPPCANALQVARSCAAAAAAAPAVWWLAVRVSARRGEDERDARFATKNQPWRAGERDGVRIDLLESGCESVGFGSDVDASRARALA